MANFLVTGAAGFLGSNLSFKLLAAGNRVIGVDDFSSGTIKNLETLKKFNNFKFIKADICQPLEFDEPIDGIYNLACPASPVFYQKMPIHTLKTCSIGVFNLASLAKQKNAKFLQASTSEVYGDPEIAPQKESYRGNVCPVGPRSCYDEGKRFAESSLANFFRNGELDARIVRIFNTYGPGMRVDDGRVVSNFIVQALENLPMTIYGSGQQTRSFCFVDDLIDGLVAAMDKDEKFLGPINLGNPKSHTIFELADLIISLTGSESKICFQKLPVDDPKLRCPDTSLAAQKLGWSAKTDLISGLNKTIEFFRSELNQNFKVKMLGKS